MKISNKDLVCALIEAGLKQNDATLFVKAVFDTIKEGLETSGRVKINGLGTFRLIDVVERDSVNVNTKKHIIIPAHKRIKFVADKDLQAKVNAEYAGLQVEMLDPIEKTWIEKLKIKIFK